MKPTLAILTDTIRFDNQAALLYFQKIRPVHFYRTAPYGDLTKDELKGAIQYEDFKDLEEKLLELKPDIIQGAEPYGSRVQLRLCRVAYRLSRKLNIPLIFPMLENKKAEERFGKITGKILKKILKRYAVQARMIFYLNEGARRNLIEARVDSRKLKKLLYGIWGVGTRLYEAKSKIKNQNAKLRNNYILFVGRLDEAKGMPYLFEAWQKIRAEFPKIELWMAGQGEWAAKAKRTPGVHSLGMVKNKELPRLFQGALFTVYPSVELPRWAEQVGMVNLQSLACGTPVITTKSGAIPEYINSKVGLLVAERDADALAEAMKKLLINAKLRQKLGERGRSYILENFDAQKTVEKTEEILLKLIK